MGKKGLVLLLVLAILSFSLCLPFAPVSADPFEVVLLPTPSAVFVVVVVAGICTLIYIGAFWSWVVIQLNLEYTGKPPPSDGFFYDQDLNTQTSKNNDVSIDYRNLRKLHDCGASTIVY